jgi:hypothetical protein
LDRLLVGSSVAARFKQDQLEKVIAEKMAMGQQLAALVIQRWGKLVIDVDKMVEIEAGVEEKADIWVLTSALEIEKQELSAAIHGNMKKGVKYTYIIPDTAGHRYDMTKLALSWQKEAALSAQEATERIQCFCVPEHFVYMTVIIYNPRGKTSNPPTVLVKFPASDIFPTKEYGLIYSVDRTKPEAWQTFVKALECHIFTPNLCGKVSRLSIQFT